MRVPNAFDDVNHRISTPWRCDLMLTVEDACIVRAVFVAPGRRTTRVPNDALLIATHRQVQAYFDRRLERFELPLCPHGTQFARDVWRLTAALSFGEFVSYADLARAAGRPLAHRGVARAMAATPIDLLIPAHRVVGSDGRLRGASAQSMRARLAAFERQPVS